MPFNEGSWALFQYLFSMQKIQMHLDIHPWPFSLLLRPCNCGCIPYRCIHVSQSESNQHVWPWALHNVIITSESSHWLLTRFVLEWFQIWNLWVTVVQDLAMCCSLYIELSWHTWIWLESFQFEWKHSINIQILCMSYPNQAHPSIADVFRVGLNMEFPDSKQGMCPSWMCTDKKFQ